MKKRPTIWHAIPVKHVFKMLSSGPEGLSGSAARARLHVHGANRIEQRQKWGWLKLLWYQLSSPLIYMLLAAALLALFLGKGTDAVVIVTVVMINTLTGFVQAIRASSAIKSLKQMMPQYAIVLRDAEQTSVPVHEIVPGDVLLLQSGDQVSADARLFEVSGLLVEESALTGESVPVAKCEAPVDNNMTLADRHSMIHGGTVVVAGTAKAVVTATGIDSEIGRISGLLNQASEVQTPLTRRLAGFARTIMQCILIVAILIFFVGMLRDYSPLDSAFAALTFAVASIPEGLPAIITIASAIGVHRMARHSAIIRHLSAVETLGSTTVICTDKTGTLTCNQMTVEAVWMPHGQVVLTGSGYEPEGELLVSGPQTDKLHAETKRLLSAAALCNDAALEYADGHWGLTGDPTEGALLVAARKAKLDEQALRETFTRLDEIPFDSACQFMATLHMSPQGKTLVCLKGAPEVVADLCPLFANGQTLQPEQVRNAAEVFATRGMRVLAVASASPEEPLYSFVGDAWHQHLRFLGFVAMVDPPRQDAIDAVKNCRTAGIAVKMVTGDHPATAGAIGRVFGLLDVSGSDAQVVTGRQLEEVNNSELIRLARAHHVFARVAPEQKLRLVQALQDDGQIVAMTGDGVNDAPALKQAEIGIAMGRSGTAAAKEAADMVLADDNFASISTAVEEGRRVYDNLLKSLIFILPTSLGQALIILVAVMFFPITDGRLLMPIEPVQILWVNLVVAVALALPLAFEAREPNLMNRPPRLPNEPLLGSPLIFRSILVGILMMVYAVGIFFYEYHADLHNGIPLGQARAGSQTVTVTTIILFQIIYLLNCRSFTKSMFRIGLTGNPYIYAGIAVTIGGLLCFIYFPSTNHLFHTYPLGLTDWVVPVVAALAGFPLIELEKRFWRKRLNSQGKR